MSCSILHIFFLFSLCQTSFLPSFSKKNYKGVPYRTTYRHKSQLSLKIYCTDEQFFDKLFSQLLRAYFGTTKKFMIEFV